MVATASIGTLTLVHDRLSQDTLNHPNSVHNG